MEEFAYRVLEWFESRDMENHLYWRCEDGKISFHVLCNDLFYWACADAEDITEENFPLLEEAYQALSKCSDPIKAHVYYTDELFACISRKMRPQDPCMKDMEEDVKALFLACGPERSKAEQG